MKIAILAGDGIGPEVMDEAHKVLETVAGKFGHRFEYLYGLIGGEAFEAYGQHFPDKTAEICAEAEAILFGSVGGPVEKMHEAKWKNCEINSILALRKRFGFNVNLRPVKVYPGLDCVLRADIVEKGIDILCVRELGGGIYFGEHRTEGDRAWDVMEYDRETIEKVAHAAFKAAMKRGKKVSSVDKANVLDCSKLWRKVVSEVGLRYPDCELEHVLVDNMAMQVLKRPFDFDVILCPNMFGDIISDEISVFAGSLGMLPSASLNVDGFGMYEPSGGSAPDIAGRGIANPIAQILSAAMMLKYSFGLDAEHDLIVSAVEAALAEGYRTADLVPPDHTFVSTRAMGDAICHFINKLYV